MSLEVGKAYEHNGWLFAVVRHRHGVFEVLTLHDGSNNGWYGSPGALEVVYAKSVVGMRAKEVE